MERLTEWDEFGNADIIALSDMMPEIYAELSFSETNALTEALSRLAKYEDTGLEPNQAMLISNVLREVGETYNCWFDYVVNCVLENSHLKDLAQAEKDGRLVVLPCKVGDKVYRVITTLDAAPVITEIKIKTLGQAADLIGRIGEKKLLVSWYLTREEAEAALKKREEAEDGLIDADEFLSKIDPDEYYHTNEIRAMVADMLDDDNAPLTPEQLREMDGDEIYTTKQGWIRCWGIEDGLTGPKIDAGEGRGISLLGYGDTWLAYRRKPEEGER